VAAASGGYPTPNRRPDPYKSSDRQLGAVPSREWTADRMSDRSKADAAFAIGNSAVPFGYTYAMTPASHVI
jgi:hypothetical protein